MNNQLLEAVQHLRLAPRQMHLLMVMAGSSDADGLCTLPVSELVHRSGYSDRNARAVLAELRSSGLIQPIGNTTGGPRVGVTYRLQIATHPCELCTPAKIAPLLRLPNAAATPAIFSGVNGQGLQSSQGSEASPLLTSQGSPSTPLMEHAHASARAVNLTPDSVLVRGKDRESKVPDSDSLGDLKKESKGKGVSNRGGVGGKESEGAGEGENKCQTFTSVLTEPASPMSDRLPLTEALAPAEHIGQPGQSGTVRPSIILDTGATHSLTNASKPAEQYANTLHGSERPAESTMGAPVANTHENSTRASAVLPMSERNGLLDKLLSAAEDVKDRPLSKANIKACCDFFDVHVPSLTPQIIERAVVATGRNTEGTTLAYFFAVMQTMIEYPGETDDERRKRLGRANGNGHGNGAGHPSPGQGGPGRGFGPDPGQNPSEEERAATRARLDRSGIRAALERRAAEWEAQNPTQT